MDGQDIRPCSRTGRLGHQFISNHQSRSSQLYSIVAGPDCSRNQLTSLDSLKNMVQLRALYCGQNRVSTLEPLNALSLIELYCNDNRIETLEPLRPMHLLERLYCGSNQIRSLSPLKGKPLYALDCSFNKITSL